MPTVSLEHSAVLNLQIAWVWISLKPEQLYQVMTFHCHYRYNNYTGAPGAL